LKILNPNILLQYLDKLLPFILVISCLILSFGFLWALFISPNDYQQGLMVKIMYLHVPSAWLSLGVYFFMTLMSIIYLVTKTPIAAIIAKAATPIGLMFTLVVLLTGVLWGRPMWGVWWVWDARLTSVLILTFIYMGLILIYRLENKQNKLLKIASFYTILGFINIPVVKFSVDWWNTLHQPASILRLDGPSIHYTMLYPLILVFIGLCFLCLSFLTIALKIEIMKSKLRKIKS
jgi:heme exporter protein C|tara:strand:- start:1701 stop:2402 length:702 start_codon:yes stop_codon:yes gene_type:complete